MNNLEKQIWILKKNAELLESPITHKLIARLKDECDDIKFPINCIIPKASLDAKYGCRVLLDTYVSNDKTYDEILDMPNAYTTIDGITASKYIGVGYCYVNILYQAKLPEDVKALLVATGNITVHYHSYESIHCSI